MITVSKEDLSDEEFETIVSSRGFQKMLLYRRLAEGIEVLQTHDMLYKSMVQAIADHHSEIDSVETVQEVLSLLEHEVETYTEPLTSTDEDESRLPDNLGSTLDDEVSDSESDETDPEQMVEEYIENRLAETGEVKVKANEIASDIGLPSTHIGGILGQWRHADDAPFAITASESPGSGNLWNIKRAGAVEEPTNSTESTVP